MHRGCFVKGESLEGWYQMKKANLKKIAGLVLLGLALSKLSAGDRETFLAWARKPYACVIFNLHIEHTSAGRARARDAFRRLIDIGITHGGSYYPTYHRHALRQQVEACYPQFSAFLAEKRRHDPHERFQSDWYRHYKTMFGA